MTTSNQPGNPNRQPSGIPSGGQFAAATRAEATVHLTSPGIVTSRDGDFAPPTGPETTFLDSDQRTQMAEATLIRAGQALRTERLDDSSAGYHDGRALADAEAFWLLQRPDVPAAHETAWAADQFIAETLHPDTGACPTRDTQREFVDNLGTCTPMSTEHARAISDHFLVSALTAADAVEVEGPTSINGGSTRALGALNGACTNAIRFRTGNPDPRPDEVTALEQAMKRRAAERKQIIRCGLPTAEEGRDVYDETFDPYAGVDFVVD